MADRIKGITIEIGGDTTGLSKALSGVNSEIRNTQSQLKDVERLLKLDPSNTELLRQKQKLLAEAVGETKSKLDTLKEANRQAAETASNYDAWKEKYDPIKEKIDETRKKLNELKKQSEDADKQLANGEISQEKYDALQAEIKDTSKELRTLQKSARDVTDEFGNPISPEQYDALQREIIETENRLKDLEKQAASSSVALEKIGAAGEKLQEFGGTVSDTGKKFMPISAGAAAAGAAAGKMAIDFQDSIADINTLLDDDTNLKGYEEKVVEMSNKTGIALGTVSEGMYQTVSSIGDGGKETEEIFEKMAISAKAGGAEVSDSVSLISAGMKGYNSINKETAGLISDLAFQTAKLGVTTFPEMAKSMQPLFPLAGSLSLSYEELFGVMATGTGVTGNTAEVSTQFKAVLSNLMKPTKSMASLMEKYGYSNAQAMIESEGLTGVLSILQEETGGQSDKMAELFSSTEALTLMTALSGAQFDTFKNKLGQMSEAAGATQTAYEKLDTSGNEIRNTINLAKNTATEFGMDLMESAVPAIRSMSEMVEDLNEWYRKLDESQKETVVQIGLVVAAMGPALIAIGGMADGAGVLLSVISNTGSALTLLSASGGPLFLTATAAAALGAAFILAKDNTVDYYEEAARLTEAEQDNRKAIDDLRESYDNLAGIRRDTVMDVESQAQKENDLWKELQNITDENGRVKAGYEDRAAFITSTLSQALDTEISITDGVIQNYKDLQSEIDNLIEKKRAEATLNAYQGEYAEAVSNTKRAQDELSEATANAKSATDNYNEALEKQKELQAEYNQLQQDYVKDGTNDALRQQLYDLQDQMLINGETIEGLRSHMEANNQTMENARLAVEAYNTTIANYEGASAAIISGDQEKISQSLWLLQNDFKTTETATRESLVSQHETIKTELANARIAFEQESPNITQAYLDGLGDLEMKSRVQLGLLAIAAGESASETAESVRSKTPEMEQAGTDFAAGLATGIQSGAQQASDAADQMANDSVDAVKTALDSHSPSRVTEEIGNEGFDAGLALGITEGAGQVTDAVTQVTDAATGALKNNLNLSQGDFSAFQSTTSSSWISWAALLTETLRTTLSQINAETNTDLQKMQTTIANYISEIEKNWEKQLNEIRKEHEESMEAVNTETTETMTEMSETIQTQTEQMKEDAVKAMNEMVIGIGEELSEVDPTIRAGFEPGVDYITSLIGEARTWGNHMMQELIQGLRDYLDELEDVCEDIADTISDNLHFTRPERGSLRNYEEWMPHFMQGLAKGIEDNRYLVAEQIQRLADDMSAIQGMESAKPVINFTNRSILVLDGKQIAETVDVYLGEAYG